MRKTKGERIFGYCNGLFLTVLCITMLYPLIYVTAASFSDPIKFMTHRGPLLKSLGFTLDAYKLVFDNPNISTGYRVTLFVVPVGTALNMLLTLLGAYFLSRRGSLWVRPVMLLVTFTMFFSGGMIPLYLVVRQVGLYDNIWALILPSAVSTYNMIIMRTSLMGIPAELEESARIDGARDFTILFRILVPVVMPTIAVLILFYGVGHWNSWFSAMLYLRRHELYPLQLILREILIQNNTDSMLMDIATDRRQFVTLIVKYAVIVISTFPILCLYPFLQRYFVKGVMVGSLKG
ncbi:MAG: carbohydrate ABC transporter permease [Treponema sp.]|nr:carbohydrate ABC transporter permease [Treponema sp.]